MSLGSSQMFGPQGATRAKGKSVIVLWMTGAPSQFETFSPKEGHANGGPTKAIETSVKGMKFSEHLPITAKQAHRLAVVRGAGWTSFRSTAWWNHGSESRQSVRGVDSGRCRVRDFEVRFDITEFYPVWERPPNAPPNLVEAWESFEDLIRQQREEYRDGLVEDGVEMRSRTRRLEEACNFLPGFPSWRSS